MSLPQVRKPIGQFNSLIAQRCETIVLKEKVLSLSGDSFDIKTADGSPLLKVKGKHMTISGRKSVYDLADNHLFDIVKEHLHLHSTYAAEDPTGKKFLEIKSSFKLIGSKATGTFTDPSGKVHTFEMKGNWLDTRADIVHKETGEIAAQIDRKLLNTREFFGSQQTYAVVVAPGIDIALVVALCIALDEKNNEK